MDYEPLTLTPGDYRVEIEGGRAPGPVRFALRDLAQAEDAPDGAVSGELADASATALHSLTLQAGQSILIDILDDADPDAATVAIYDPGGSRVAISQYEDRILGTAAQTGRYTVVFAGRGAAGTALNYSFELGSPQVGGTGALALGGTIVGTAPEDGQVFDVAIDLDAETPAIFETSGSGSAALIGADGEVLWSGGLALLDVGNRVDDPALTLPAGATTLRLWAQPDDWSVRLFDLGTAQALSDGQTVDVSTAEGAAPLIGTIEVTDYETLDVARSFPVAAVIIDPTGVVRGDAWMPLAGQGGQATVLAYSTRDNDGTSPVTVALTPPQTSSLPPDIAHTVSTVAGAGVVWDIPVTAPGPHLMSVGNLQDATLIAPDGSVLLGPDDWSRDDTAVAVLGEGTWRIVAPPPRFDRTNIVRWQSFATAPLLAAGETDLGSGNIFVARVPATGDAPVDFALSNADAVAFYDVATGARLDLPEDPRQRLAPGLPEMAVVSTDASSSFRNTIATLTPVEIRTVDIDVTTGTGAPAERLAERGGQVLRLDGIGAAVDGAPAPNGARTVEAWVRFDDSTRGSLLAIGGIELTVSADRFEVEIADGAGTRELSDFTRRTPGDWHHVAVRITADGTAALFVDGSLQRSVTLGALPGATAAPRIGAGAAGAMDDLRIWGAALDDAAIAALVTTPPAADAADLLLDLDFEGALPGTARSGADVTLASRISAAPLLSDPVGGGAVEVRHRFALAEETSLWLDALSDWRPGDSATVVFSTPDGAEQRVDIVQGAAGVTLGPATGPR
ncbi:Concanavalin A-like lectin/glucanases superfamily protein [Palleronia salina]|uniref:Concanavalin A-like lectin/glucanases superfamily protein n=1 Tax=Palleronia salina TaxID=313368 RepID=A0A1M6KNG9_9RHOB|nr:LamG domain-containing protein [Palleronia salina]SHJ60461.1 Concanavalin A-like lectin/glucanases superfamily protein [Palleronia salina]